MAGLVVLFAGFTLRRNLHLNPILKREGVLLALGLGRGGHDVEVLAKPFHRPTHQFGGINAREHFAFSIRQLVQRGHDIVADIGSLQGVVGPPESPHARHVMMRDVTVVEEIAGSILATARAALDRKIVSLRWANGLYVNTIGGTAHRRELHRAATGQSEIVDAEEIEILRQVGLPPPANRPAVQMVRVEHLRATVYQTPLGRVAQIGPGDRCRGIAKGVGAVAH